MFTRRVAAGCLLALVSVSPALAIGAIAVDSEQGQKAGDEGYGIGWGQSRDEARANAIKQCSGAGNDACKVVAWFETCGAYATNRSVYGVGWGSTEADARSMALDNCDNCKVTIAECE